MNHTKLEAIDKSLLLEIPITNQYTYLGVEINYSGSIIPAFSRLTRRAQYLQRSLKKYASGLRYENQFLIWNTYIRPYF
jgi:hypothetical protein